MKGVGRFGRRGRGSGAGPCGAKGKAAAQAPRRVAIGAGVAGVPWKSHSAPKPRAEEGRQEVVESEAAVQREAAKQEAIARYFEDLPQDRFTEPEEELRTALLDAVAAEPSVRLSVLGELRVVREAKAKLAWPADVRLNIWIQNRMAAELCVEKDPASGQFVLRVPGDQAQDLAAPEEDVLDKFFATLPLHFFSESENALREQLLLALKRHGGRSKLSALAKARDVQDARNALLPKEAPMLTWIERRLGKDISVSREGDGSTVLALIPSAQPPRAKHPGPPPALPLGRQERAARPEGPPPPQRYLQARSVEDDQIQKAESREAATNNFFASLPEGTFSASEQELRDAILDALEASRVPLRLSAVCSAGPVRNAKSALLPSNVSLASWIENRIGEEVAIGQDERGQVTIELAPREDAPTGNMLAEERGTPTGKMLAEQRDARVLEYFQDRPLEPEERRLRTALLEAAAWQGGRGGPLAHLLQADSEFKLAWQAAKAMWRTNVDPPLEVSLTRWVELRVDVVRVTREPHVQLTKAEMERRGLSKKRPSEAFPAGPMAKFPRNGTGDRGATKGGATKGGAKGGGTGGGKVRPSASSKAALG